MRKGSYMSDIRISVGSNCRPQTSNILRGFKKWTKASKWKVMSWRWQRGWRQASTLSDFKAVKPSTDWASVLTMAGKLSKLQCFSTCLSVLSWVVRREAVSLVKRHFSLSPCGCYHHHRPFRHQTLSLYLRLCFSLTILQKLPFYFVVP